MLVLTEYIILKLENEMHSELIDENVYVIKNMVISLLVEFYSLTEKE